MMKSWRGRILSWSVFGVILIAAYFINVEVQSYLGRQALEKTGLVSLSFEQALDKAKSEKKLVLVDVSAIWCSTCRKLDNEIFADEDVKRFINDKFFFSRLEYESDEGQKFLEKYNVSGFPTLMLMDSGGNMVKKLQVTFDKHQFLWQLNQ